MSNIDMIERVARALFQRDVEEDVCDGTWEENKALHERILADACAAVWAMQEPSEAVLEAGPPEPYMDRETWAKMVRAAIS